MEKLRIILKSKPTLFVFLLPVVFCLFQWRAFCVAYNPCIDNEIDKVCLFHSLDLWRNSRSDRVMLRSRRSVRLARQAGLRRGRSSWRHRGQPNDGVSYRGEELLPTACQVSHSTYSPWILPLYCQLYLYKVSVAVSVSLTAPNYRREKRAEFNSVFRLIRRWWKYL